MSSLKSDLELSCFAIGSIQAALDFELRADIFTA
jgi:hypothetical protein